ncbi:hypothetical protein PMZ80_009202 [Knufia obscura]|uniref:Zn(2)-C6 fungal-type domain-containing protein n=1 Tax=Knufia obscura TaxID=1635080 RepID=A0ABR0RC74_9EURO|nr:hypothetical protein PMZ80_009202 [Knufia obscura]
MMSAAMMSAEGNPYKRPASPTGELQMPPAKVPKTGTGQLQINYLKREKKETIPLATAEEPLPRLLRLISEYDGVLQRHESLAGNLGACPVGPILLKRFERLFEGPPRILKSNSRDPNITWLDVVEFAQNKPEQFDLEKTRNGIRVCQFYLKQCRVEISEEDYVLIRSGMPQKLIPPQPILEDEEKELGVLEVLDRNLAKVVHSADQVSARARQLVHRLKNRRAAILARREVEGDSHKNVLKSNDLPPSPAFDHNAAPPRPVPQPAPAPAPTPVTAPAPAPTQAPAAMPTHSPSISAGGFTAVNARHSLSSTEHPAYHVAREPPREMPREMPRELPREPPRELQREMPRELPRDIPREIPQDLQREMQRDMPRDIAREMPINGSLASPIQHIAEQKPVGGQAEDWMNKFLTPSERAAGMTADTIRRETLTAAQRSTSRGETVPAIDDSMRMASMSARRQESRRQSEGALPDRNQAVQQPEAQGPSVPIPSTPASLMPQQKPHTWNRDDGGPYKSEMISRMETMKRGERVIPPCDRCRRLHMDCIKNLTACLGCTKKHAKCSWKDVSLDELESTAPAARERAEKEAESAAPSSSDWDNILKQTKGDLGDPARASPTSNSPATNDKMDVDMSSNKASTPRMPTPPQNGSSNGRPPSHPHESPRLNVRPPPLDQQLRDAAEDKTVSAPAPAPAMTPHTPFSRYSPFHRPHSAHLPSTAPPKAEPMADEGDRLAAVAAQVYRSASQNAARVTEARAGEAS